MEEKKTQFTLNIKDMSLNMDNPYITYSFKKTQKISQALYIVTGYFEPSEPLRNTIRSNANDIINIAISLLKNDQKDRRILTSNLIASLMESMAFLETAKLVNLMSENNFIILKTEVEGLIDTLEKNQEKKIQLSREFMFTENLDEYRKREDFYKGQIPVLNIKDTIKPLKTTSLPSVKDNKSKRADTVLSLFRPGVELMIKDISLHLKDVSEKTIQRELLSLVEKGKLSKIGKKRWSKYKLN